MIIKFEADEVFIKQRKMDKSWSVELGAGEYQYDKIMALPFLNGKVMRVTIETDE